MAGDSHTDEMEWPVETEKSFALSGKIMLSAIVILFAVIVFMLLLHVYWRWYLLTVRRREISRRRNRSRLRHRAHIVFYDDNHNGPGAAVGAINHGLDDSVLKSLPVFVYSSKTHADLLECAVCLSEFEENEKGRLLTKCNHSFHIECIDMWFHSHSTCPLCRSPVEAVGVQPQAPESSISDVVLSIGELADTEPGSSSGNCTVSQNMEENNASTSLGVRRKGVDMAGVTIEVPRRNELEGELGVISPASHGFKSPGSRLLSFKRLLSMNRIIAPGTSSGPGVAESDIECGKDESTHGQTRPHTPR